MKTEGSRRANILRYLPVDETLNTAQVDWFKQYFIVIFCKQTCQVPGSDCTLKAYVCNFLIKQTKLIDENVMQWTFSYWPCHRSSASLIGLRMAVFAIGFASGQYSNTQASTSAFGPDAGPI